MAVIPPLMSERDEPGGGAWTDCTYASGIMAVYKAGRRNYELGWTNLEREALERSDDRPDETGANFRDLQVAVKRRYNYDLPVLAGSLSTALRGPATRGYTVPGKMSEVPVYLRRWQPSFTGWHHVYVQPMGDGQYVRWMDPLAPWGFAGDIVPVDTVIRYNAPVGPAQCLVAREGSGVDYRLTVVPYPTQKTWRVNAGTTLAGYSVQTPGRPVVTKTFATASTASADADVTVTWLYDTTPPVPRGGPFIRVTSGVFKGLLVPKARVII